MGTGGSRAIDYEINKMAMKRGAVGESKMIGPIGIKQKQQVRQQPKQQQTVKKVQIKKQPIMKQTTTQVTQKQPKSILKESNTQYNTNNASQRNYRDDDDNNTNINHCCNHHCCNCNNNHLPSCTCNNNTHHICTLSHTHNCTCHNTNHNHIVHSSPIDSTIEHIPQHQYQCHQPSYCPYHQTQTQQLTRHTHLPPPHIVDLTPLLQSDTSDLITYEYKKNRLFLSDDEKFKAIPLAKPHSPPTILYHKIYNIHTSSITSILTLSPSCEGIHYATASTDNTIKLWSALFHMLSHITTQHAHSTCLAQHKRKYLLSAEGVYIYMYKLRPPHKTHFIFRSHTAEVLHIMPLSQDVFISSGKDATIRLWKENVIRFYEGHRSCVRKVSKVFNMRNMASYGDDKKIFIWEYTQAIALNSIDVYYTCADIVGTNFGFVTGSYDNKLRMYNMKEGNGELFAVFDMDYYYCRNIIIANEEENVYLFTNFINEIIALDVKERTVVKVLKGNVGECKVNMVVKDYQWVNHEDEHEKNVIAVCDDGCAYVWNCGFLNETAVNTENADEQAEDYEPTIEQYTVDDGDNNTEHVVNSEKEVEIDQEELMTESES